MKKHLITTILFFLYFNLFGQILKGVNDVLSKKDFNNFKLYTEEIKSNHDPAQANWSYQRELTKSYLEGIFHFRQYVNSDNSHEYTVNLISNNNEIIYYQLIEKKSKVVNENWVYYYIPIDTFKNDSLFSDLNASFKRTFGLEINESELFIESIVFGRSCGWGGDTPYERLEMNMYINNKDKKSILIWLQSTNTEKQVYALYGLRQLKKRGVLLTEKEAEMIKAVKNKKGTVCFCAGCFYEKKKIRKVLRTVSYKKVRDR